MSIVERLTGNDGRLRIGDDRVAASDGAQIEVVDPSTGEHITSVASASVSDVGDAMEAAAAAAASWRATAPRERSEILRRAFALMIERADAFAELIVLEMGKAFDEARGEIVYAAEFYRWFSEEAVRIYGSVLTSPGGDKRIVALPQPVGVCLFITPWNFPAAMVTRKIGPAIAAGCTMLWKPASDTPLTALALADLMREAGLPPGVLNVVPSNRSSKVVPAILNDSRLRKLSFTGSTEVGRTLLHGAADRVVNVSMELGGNAPFIVFEDADIEDAVRGAVVAKMRNGGQSCVAANRFYVHEAVADEFSGRFAEAMAATKVGPGMEPGVELGPLINARAQSDVHELVGAATGAGASIATGGEAPDRPGFFYMPTVLTSVARDNPVLGHEIFGPVAPVVTFDREHDAVDLANDTEHGLVAYVYTSDLAKAMRVSEAIETGMVGINRGLVSDPAAPFGGVKQSGLGREGGREGILGYVETKYIATDW